MSNTTNDFNSDLEAILAEFSSYSDSLSGGASKPEAKTPAAPESEAAKPRESAGGAEGHGGAQY